MASQAKGRARAADDGEDATGSRRTLGAMDVMAGAAFDLAAFEHGLGNGLASPGHDGGGRLDVRIRALRRLVIEPDRVHVAQIVGWRAIGDDGMRLDVNRGSTGIIGARGGVALVDGDRAVVAAQARLGRGVDRGGSALEGRTGIDYEGLDGGGVSPQGRRSVWIGMVDDMANPAYIAAGNPVYRTIDPVIGARREVMRATDDGCPANRGHECDHRPNGQAAKEKS